LPSDIGDALRRLLGRRAAYDCEYCLLNEDDSFSPHQVDHIISRKHGGLSVESNLAYACLRCNMWKGSDIASVESSTGRLTPLYHPRRQQWEEHFRLQGGIVEPLTPEGIVTVRLLRLNDDRRVAERRLLIAAGRYPRFQG
jgi:hypothetical protein